MTLAKRGQENEIKNRVEIQKIVLDNKESLKKVINVNNSWK